MTDQQKPPLLNSHANHPRFPMKQTFKTYARNFCHTQVTSTMRLLESTIIQARRMSSNTLFPYQYSNFIHNQAACFVTNFFPLINYLCSRGRSAEPYLHGNTGLLVLFAKCLYFLKWQSHTN